MAIDLTLLLSMQHTAVSDGKMDGYCSWGRDWGSSRRRSDRAACRLARATCQRLG